MISVDVNGKDRLISEEAWERLNLLLVPLGEPMCVFSSKVPPKWGCTRKYGHKGPHVGHGEVEGKADTYAVFTRAERRSYG